MAAEPVPRPAPFKPYVPEQAGLPELTLRALVLGALLDGGKTAEVKLHRFQGLTDAPVVIHNLRYWGAPRNDGFVLMPNTVEALRTGDKAYEFKGTNGFMITVDLNSKDFAPTAAKSGM